MQNKRRERRRSTISASIAVSVFLVLSHSASGQQSAARDSVIRSAIDRALVMADSVRVQRTALAPVVVSIDAKAPTVMRNRLETVGFFRRRQYSGVPASQFMTRDMIEKFHVEELTQLLRRVKGRGWGCADGVLYVDGVLLAKPPHEVPVDSSRITVLNSGPRFVASTPMPVATRLDLIPLDAVEAVEVYTGPSEIPVEFNAAFRQARCVVLVWTR